MFFNKKNDLENFLLGKGKNNNGVYIYDTWNYSDTELEYLHNYIQWLFPLEKKSKYNIFAPIVKNNKIYNNKEIQTNILKSFERMIKFYGFEYKGKKIVKSNNFNKCSENWLRPNNHNYLRITRILKCLVSFNLNKEAIYFLDALLNIYKEAPERISERTIGFWIRAVYGGKENEYDPK